MVDHRIRTTMTIVHEMFVNDEDIEEVYGTRDYDIIKNHLQDDITNDQEAYEFFIYDSKLSDLKIEIDFVGNGEKI